VVDVLGSWAGSQHVDLFGRARVEGLVQVALSGYRRVKPLVVYIVWVYKKSEYGCRKSREYG
jgi:hypothetical protein